MNTPHLTDEQFSEFLAGETSNPVAAGHLESCATCSRELTSMRSAVGTLRGLSLRWAEERAARIVTPSRWTLGWHRLPAWSAATSMLLCGLALGAHFQGVMRPAAPEMSQSQTVIATPSDDELAEDNQLLRSIDRELNRQVTPQVPASELAVSSRTLRHHVLREESN